MATYFLLRNNNKSGPFLLHQLKEMGLKPYDLIWVDGKSAAWRYPGEVEDLKEFAPIVEEQPYDRFFKKPDEMENKHFHELVEEAGINKLKKNPAIKKRKIPAKKKSKIFISMPEPSYLSMSPDHLNESFYEKSSKKSETSLQTEDSALAPEKNQPAVNNVNNKYAGTYKKRVQKNHQNKSTKKLAEYAVAFLFLFSLGTLIYLNFKPGNFKLLTDTAPVQIKPSQNNDTPESAVLNDAASSSLPELTVPATNLASVKKEPLPAEKKKNTNELMIAKENAEPVADELVTFSTVVHAEEKRQKSVRNDVSSGKELAATIFSQVSVKTNEYKRRAFGGIENLQLTVFNSSGFFLDKVVVELTYLKPSELPLKTEKIEFSSIDPNGSVTLKIPDSPRGIKVHCKITQITSDRFEKFSDGM